MDQLSFLSPGELPPGLSYQPEFITVSEEDLLLRFFRDVKLAPYEYQGYMARRNVHHFETGDSLPEILKPFLLRAAEKLKVSPKRITHVLITHYPVGAPIGWHRDAPPFEHLLGISLLSSCSMKLREMSGEGRQSLFLERRSAYSMTGPSRWRWEHHIPPVKEERYSLTFRTHVKDNPVSDHELYLFEILFIGFVNFLGSSFIRKVLFRHVFLLLARNFFIVRRREGTRR